MKTLRLAFAAGCLFLLSGAGCTTEEETTSDGGCGTQMGCCPATGCSPPNSWYGSSTGYCYSTANNCTNAGNSNCRQCY